MRKPALRSIRRLTHNSKEYTDPHTGQTYLSLKLMKSDQRLRKTLMLNDFARMVSDGTLGQEPWERLPIETDVHYHRFRTYLTMGPQDGKFDKGGTPAPPREYDSPRSVVRLANLLNCPWRNLKSLAARNHWNLRAELYDRELHRQEDEAFKEEKRAATRKQARLGARLQELAGRGIDCLMVAPGELSASDVVRLSDTGVKIERLAHDKSTSNDATTKEIRFVFPGAKPKWADHSEVVVEAAQVERGTTIEGEA